MSWQPIETAPKSGNFIGWREGWEEPRLVFWSSWASCWCEENTKLEYPGMEPTHWMPLPRPPEATP